MTKLNPLRRNLFTLALRAACPLARIAGSRARNGTGTRSRSDPSELYAGRRPPHRSRDIQTQAWDCANLILPRGTPSGLVVVDATSGDSGSHARDHKMHKDILESAQYPEITFTPEQVQGQVLPQGDFKVQVLGTFTMHGAGHPLTLVVQAHLAGEQLTADTQFHHPLCELGLKESQHAVPPRQRYR